MENEYESYFALKNKFDLVIQAYKSYFAVKKIENLCLKKISYYWKKIYCNLI